MVKLEFRKRGNFSAFYDLYTKDPHPKPIAIFEYFAGDNSATMTYGQDVWSFSKPGNDGVIALNGALLGRIKESSDILSLMSSCIVELNDGTSFTYKTNFWTTRFILFCSNGGIEGVRDRGDNIECLDAEAIDRHAVFVAALLKYIWFFLRIQGAQVVYRVEHSVH